MYMFPYRCKVTGTPGNAAVAPAIPATWCEDNPSNCTKGARQLIYWNQLERNNIVVSGTDLAGYPRSPAYNAKLGFQNGLSLFFENCRMLSLFLIQVLNLIFSCRPALLHRRLLYQALHTKVGHQVFIWGYGKRIFTLYFYLFVLVVLFLFLWHLLCRSIFFPLFIPPMSTHCTSTYIDTWTYGSSSFI
jgi:hypothetical protein